MEFNEKQLQIIEMAEKLFATKGFNGTSIRDIAEQADINIAMISYYFGSKEKLMEALFELKIGRVQVRVESLLENKNLTPIEKVNILIDEHIDRTLKSQQFYKIMLFELMTDSTPTIKAKVKELKFKNVELITKLIKTGQKTGDFKKDIDVVIMLNAMIGTVWQTFLNKEIYRDFGKNKLLSEDAYLKQIQKKLSIHIKTLFKVILTNEV